MAHQACSVGPMQVSQSPVPSVRSGADGPGRAGLLIGEQSPAGKPPQLTGSNSHSPQNVGGRLMLGCRHLLSQLSSTMLGRQ